MPSSPTWDRTSSRALAGSMQARCWTALDLQNDARSAHTGNGVCRVSFCLSCGYGRPGPFGPPRCVRRAVGDIRSVLPVDLRGSSLPSLDNGPASIAGSAFRDHGRRGRRHSQPSRLVCPACDVHLCLADRLWPAAALAARSRIYRLARSGASRAVRISSTLEALEYSRRAGDRSCIGGSADDL